MIALAVGAHPDDIEFMMSGTLLLLKQAGVGIHICNLANGCYGSEVYSKDETALIRALEAQAAARVAGAEWHPSMFDDLGLYYDAPSLAKVSSLIREVKPDIVLTLSLHDYMEDHEYAARLTSSAVFNRCLPSYVTDPPFISFNKPVAVYHALPHGLRDMERNPITPEFVIDVESVLPKKRAMLSEHKSQKDWLDATQGMGSYVESMVEFCHEVGQQFGHCAYGEGWRRHNHLGYCPPDFAPLQNCLTAFLKSTTQPE